MFENHQGKHLGFALDPKNATSQHLEQTKICQTWTKIPTQIILSVDYIKEIYLYTNCLPTEK